MEVSHYTHQNQGRKKKTESLKMFQVKLISTKWDEKGNSIGEKTMDEEQTKQHFTFDGRKQ